VRYGIVFIALLGGCSHAAWQISAGQPPPVSSAVQVHASGGGLAAALGITILAAGAYEMARNGAFFARESSRPPEMAPDRKISEQDCSRPLDYSLGNIRCK
jgi:hypothetical protein